MSILFGVRYWLRQLLSQKNSEDQTGSNSNQGHPDFQPGPVGSPFEQNFLERFIEPKIKAIAEQEDMELSDLIKKARKLVDSQANEVDLKNLKGIVSLHPCPLAAQPIKDAILDRLGEVEKELVEAKDNSPSKEVKSVELTNSNELSGKKCTAFEFRYQGSTINEETGIWHVYYHNQDILLREVVAVVGVHLNNNAIKYTKVSSASYSGDAARLQNAIGRSWDNESNNIKKHITHVKYYSNFELMSEPHYLTKLSIPKKDHYLVEIEISETGWLGYFSVFYENKEFKVTLTDVKDKTDAKGKKRFDFKTDVEKTKLAVSRLCESVRKVQNLIIDINQFTNYGAGPLTDVVSVRDCKDITAIQLKPCLTDLKSNFIFINNKEIGKAFADDKGEIKYVCTNNSYQGDGLKLADAILRRKITLSSNYNSRLILVHDIELSDDDHYLIKVEAMQNGLASVYLYHKKFCDHFVIDIEDHEIDPQPFSIESDVSLVKLKNRLNILPLLFKNHSQTFTGLWGDLALDKDSKVVLDLYQDWSKGLWAVCNNPIAEISIYSKNIETCNRYQGDHGLLKKALCVRFSQIEKMDAQSKSDLVVGIEELALSESDLIKNGIVKKASIPEPSFEPVLYSLSFNHIPEKPMFKGDLAFRLSFAIGNHSVEIGEAFVLYNDAAIEYPTSINIDQLFKDFKEFDEISEIDLDKLHQEAQLALKLALDIDPNVKGFARQNLFLANILKEEYDYVNFEDLDIGEVCFQAFDRRCKSTAIKSSRNSIKITSDNSIYILYNISGSDRFFRLPSYLERSERYRIDTISDTGYMPYDCKIGQIVMKDIPPSDDEMLAAVEEASKGLNEFIEMSDRIAPNLGQVLELYLIAPNLGQVPELYLRLDRSGHNGELKLDLVESADPKKGDQVYASLGSLTSYDFKYQMIDQTVQIPINEKLANRLQSDCKRFKDFDQLLQGGIYQTIVKTQIETALQVYLNRHSHLIVEDNPVIENAVHFTVAENDSTTTKSYKAYIKLLDIVKFYNNNKTLYFTIKNDKCHLYFSNYLKSYECIAVKNGKEKPAVVDSENWKHIIDAGYSKDSILRCLESFHNTCEALGFNEKMYRIDLDKVDSIFPSISPSLSVLHKNTLKFALEEIDAQTFKIFLKDLSPIDPYYEIGKVVMGIHPAKSKTILTEAAKGLFFKYRIALPEVFNYLNVCIHHIKHKSAKPMGQFSKTRYLFEPDCSFKYNSTSNQSYFRFTMLDNSELDRNINNAWNFQYNSSFDFSEPNEISGRINQNKNGSYSVHLWSDSGLDHRYISHIVSRMVDEGLKNPTWVVMNHAGDNVYSQIDEWRLKSDLVDIVIDEDTLGWDILHNGYKIGFMGNWDSGSLKMDYEVRLGHYLGEYINLTLPSKKLVVPAPALFCSSLPSRRLKVLQFSPSSADDLRKQEESYIADKLKEWLGGNWGIILPKYDFMELTSDNAKVYILNTNIFVGQSRIGKINKQTKRIDYCVDLNQCTKEALQYVIGSIDPKELDSTKILCGADDLMKLLGFIKIKHFASASNSYEMASVSEKVFDEINSFFPMRIKYEHNTI